MCSLSSNHVLDYEDGTSALPSVVPRTDCVKNITILPDLSADAAKPLKECYTAFHPDAKWWTPDVEDGPHFSEWAQFDIQDIYYVGGFGE